MYIYIHVIIYHVSPTVCRSCSEQETKNSATRLRNLACGNGPRCLWHPYLWYGGWFQLYHTIYANTFWQFLTCSDFSHVKWLYIRRICGLNMLNLYIWKPIHEIVPGHLKLIVSATPMMCVRASKSLKKKKHTQNLVLVFHGKIRSKLFVSGWLSVQFLQGPGSKAQGARPSEMFLNGQPFNHPILGYSPILKHGLLENHPCRSHVFPWKSPSSAGGMAANPCCWNQWCIISLSN